MNKKFPWKVPAEGVETLPRLFGRAKVTLQVRRPTNNLKLLPPDNFLAQFLPSVATEPLGNITIVSGRGGKVRG